jgi:hypothetical protein
MFRSVIELIVIFVSMLQKLMRSLDSAPGGSGLTWALSRNLNS